MQYLRSRLVTAATRSLTTLILTGCMVIGTDSKPQPQSPNESSAGATGTNEPVTVTVVSHDSFNMDETVLADFTAETGITIEILAQEDAGTLANQLVLTKGSPLADLVF